MPRGSLPLERWTEEEIVDKGSQPRGHILRERVIGQSPARKQREKRKGTLKPPSLLTHSPLIPPREIPVNKGRVCTEVGGNNQIIHRIQNPAGTLGQERKAIKKGKIRLEKKGPSISWLVGKKISHVYDTQPKQKRPVSAATMVEDRGGGKSSE